MGTRHASITISAVLAVATLAGCGSSKTATSSTHGSKTAPPGSQGNGQAIGKRTKTSGCTAHPPLPDPACTPGAIISSATKAQICVPGYSRKTRRVSSSTKRRAYLEYGISSHRPFQYEVDHLISLELGGSNGIANLWPEPASPRPGFHEKDKVEDYLHQQVCNGSMSLSEAQDLIAHNWMKVYRKIT